jgi:hypothetical protein
MSLEEEESMEGLGASASRPGSRASTEPLSAQGLGPSGFDPSRNLKAVYYDQTVRMLRELIASERDWIVPKAAGVVNGLTSDVLYPYAFNEAADVYARAVRLSVMESVLSAMTRNVEHRDSDRSGEAGETAKTGSTEGESAGPKDIAHPHPLSEGTDSNV